MARTIAEIQAQMDAEQATQSGLSGLNSPSSVAIYTLWKFITASMIWAHEKLWDIFKVELEAVVDSNEVGTTKWVQNKIFEFQYSDTTPQIIQLVNFHPAYDPIDETLQIVTRASVKTLPSRIVSVKVAKEEPPTALTSSEINSLADYLDDISFAGVQYQLTSNLPDRMYLAAEVFYNGQYSNVIATTVIEGINNYLSNIPFDGIIRVSSLEDAIQNVTGVTDIVISDMAVRDNSTLFANKTYLVQNKTTIFRSYPLNAGYVVEEDAPNDLLTILTFTPEQ